MVILHLTEGSQSEMDPMLCFYTQRGFWWWKNLTFQHRKNKVYNENGSVMLMRVSYKLPDIIRDANHIKAQSGDSDKSGGGVNMDVNS